MLKNILGRVCKRYNAVRPRVIVGVPSGITEVEERAVEESIMRAGAREVYLIEEPMAAAIGAGIEIEEPSGNIIVDIGGGTTEVAVISLGGIVVCNSLRIAGDELDETGHVMIDKDRAITESTSDELKKLGLSPKPCGKGICATIGSGGKTLLLRADMDALPMAEQSGEEFACTSGKTAHTCGHDLHAAMLLSAAKLICEPITRGSLP